MDIGDARNLHRTLLSIAMQDQWKPDIRKRGKCFHFTVNDHKPAVIARDILVLLMLHESSGQLQLSDGQEGEMLNSELLPLLYYTYLAPVMPKMLYDMLQGYIKKAIDALEAKRSFLRSWTFRSCIELIFCGFCGSGKAKLTRSIQRDECDGRLSDRMQQTMRNGTPGLEAPADFRKQEEFYFKTGVLFLNFDHEHLLGEELNAAYDAFDQSRPRAPSNAVLEHRNRESWEMDIDVAHNPFELAIKIAEEGMTGTEGEGLFHRTFNWFHSVARAMKQSQGRYFIEACVGDVNSVMEQISYGMVGHREDLQSAATAGAPSGPAPTASQSAQAKELSVYPVIYDRVHLHFNNEYIGLNVESDLEKTFRVRMEPLPFPEDSPLVVTAYIRWHRTETSAESGQLMARDELERWLHRLFLKLSIPKERQGRDFVLIYSPLNLTAFVRLCSHLHHIGYPAHRISGVLSEIMSGKLTSKARPPRSEPLKIREVKDEASNKVIEQSTAPFVAELSTLVSLWQQAGALPFGILSTAIPDVALVHKYSVIFDDVPDLVAETPSFVLLLLDAGLLPPGSKTIRPYLLSDEESDKSRRAQAIRERGLHVLSMWEWHRPNKTATFWLRKDVFEALDVAKWSLSVWRTDNYISQSRPQRMSDVRDLGAWLDGST
ncbi:hypothetical protein LTR85_009859 [Meristemomyces frigidus]|nr:hypothetical protein LTR85_009859 [Meristemomyces frigidus]